MPEYSISQLGKFEECVLLCKFIYVDGIKRYEEGVEAFLGQRFHDAMEWLYKTGVPGVESARRSKRWHGSLCDALRIPRFR